MCEADPLFYVDLFNEIIPAIIQLSTSDIQEIPFASVLNGLICCKLRWTKKNQTIVVTSSSAMVKAARIPPGLASHWVSSHCQWLGNGRACSIGFDGIHGFCFSWFVFKSVIAFSCFLQVAEVFVCVQFAARFAHWHVSKDK